MALHPRVRMAATGLMCSLVRVQQLDKTISFEAVGLLDLLRLHDDDEATFLQKLPATCAALINILTKKECSTAKIRIADYVAYANQFAVCILNPEASCTKAAVFEQEKAIIKSFDWMVEVPTVVTWLQLYSTRLDVLTEGAYSASIKWAYHQSALSAQPLVCYVSASPEAAPRDMAAGLLLLSMTNAPSRLTLMSGRRCALRTRR